MQPGPKRNDPAEGTQRAHGAVAHAAHMVAQAMHRKTELGEHQEASCSTLPKARRSACLAWSARSFCSSS